VHDNNNRSTRLTKLTKIDKTSILSSYMMRNCICGHDISWHWMDIHRQGRCVYHINEYDACHCKKYIKGEDEEKEMTLEEKNQE
jgi:ferredoxin-thioredoxin reductase catalytic subunit